jgi:uncharacterized membrane protein
MDVCMDQKEELNVSRIIVVYKFALGLIELISGLAIAFFGKQLLAGYFLQLSQELSEDPHDAIAHLSLAVVPNLFTHNTVIVITLFLLGMAKIAGAIGLVYKKNWGIDLLVGLTVIMAPFQLINVFTHQHFFDFLYLLIGIVIALYLMRFKPGAWISRVFQKLKSGLPTARF